MKEKMLALSTKKVAEARARKNKRAKTKLAAGKKQAEAVANSADMSEAMKLKAISKALRGKEAKKPGKSYVVAKKGRGGNGPKGAKLVDKRLKSDTRGEKRATKKQKGTRK
jgi:AdoMet-dependent rRNA methyltransferase SPB1